MATKRKVTAPAAAPAARKRARLVAGEVEAPPAGASYFASAEAKAAGLKFVSSGCSIMDAALGGGYVLGRVVNVVGDRSAGKTLIAMEVSANFAITYKDGWIRYAEAESAFDKAYAAEMGMPVERVTFNADGQPIETIEQVHDDLVKMMDENKGRPGLYILDSLDAISDEDEMAEDDFNKGTYGGKKPKQIGKLFRKLVSRMEQENVLLLVISQIRDKIGVTFGETKTRSGGKALDFYATHIVWIATIQTLKKTINGIERPIGVRTRAKVKKNKVGLPFREAEYNIIFGYGIDDLTAAVEWLIEVGRGKELTEKLGITQAGYKVRIANIRNKGGQEVKDLRDQLRKMVFKAWGEIETTFLNKAKKYD